MKDFLIGAALGALGAYVATKLTEEETRRKIVEDIEYGFAVGKSKALRAGVIAKNEYLKGQEVLEKGASEVRGKLAEGLSDLSEKVRP